MNEIKLVFKNYKLLKEGEFNLSDGSIFLMQGPNNAGKTSFVNALKAIMEAKDETVNPVSFGEKEGYILGSIPGADGQMYQFRYDYNVDGKRKFSFIGPDNKAIKSVTEMRAIFNYTHFTADEFFSWSLDAKGRAKQKEILMKLLSDKEQAEIANIDSMINSGSGTKFLQRQNINRELDGLKSIVEKGLDLTAEQQKVWNMKDDVISLFDKIKVQKKEVDDFMAKSSSGKELHDTICSQLVELESNYAATEVKDNQEIVDIDEQIRKLTEKRNTIVKRIETDKVEYEKKHEDITKKKVEAEKLFDKAKIDEYNLLLAGTPEKDGINVRYENGEKMIKVIDAIKAREENLTITRKTYEDKTKDSTTITEEIETLRKRKTDIIKNSDSIPHEFEIGDDHITVDNVPFTETDLCKSSAIKAVAKLMMKINDAPIMLMGDAEHLGYAILDELKEFAENNNKVMVFAEHVRALDEMKLVCYDDIEHEHEVKSNKELF